MRAKTLTRAVGSALAALVLLASARAPGLEWPDVADRVERDLSSDDIGTRLMAAHQLKALGPVHGGPLALAALDDADDDVRLAAADAAMRLRVQGATDRVATWLNAPSVRLRRKACEVAAAMPSARAIPALARALGDPDADVRDSAARALGRQSAPEAVAPLLGRLDDTSPTVRISIAAALAHLKDPRAVVPLVGKVQDSSPEVRQAVARTLGELGDSRASAPLVTMLRDRSADVRREALTALGLLRAADAVDAIAGFLADRSASLRFAALQALSRVPTADAMRVLVAALGSGEESSSSLDATPVRGALVAAGAAAIPALRDCLASSKVQSVVAGAAWVLGALKAQAVAPAIVEAMRSGSLPPAFAMRALAGAGTAAEAPVVLEFVTDPSAVVRNEALGAATVLLDPRHPDGRAVEPLAAALRDVRASVQERARIAMLLGRTGAARAAPLLAQLARSGNVELRSAAIDALGALGAAGQDDALLEALVSPDASLRLHAAIALSNAGGGQARAALVAKLNGDDEVDRACLLTALGGIVARIPSSDAIDGLAANLHLAAGPERDATLEAIGRAPAPGAVRILAEAARSQEPFDRRAVASALAAHGADAVALGILRSLLGDADATVRAQAVWSLGSVGDLSDLGRLEACARDSDRDVSVNALAAIGRIAARSRSAEAATRLLCPALSGGVAYARANALAGLGAAGARCPQGAPERLALADDPSEEVRGAAALAVTSRASPDDVRALESCARGDPSVAVSSRCKSPPKLPTGTNHVLVYVVPEGSSEPRPDAGYGLVGADGLLRLGRADRRGAVFDPVAPDGPARLVSLTREAP